MRKGNALVPVVAIVFAILAAGTAAYFLFVNNVVDDIKNVSNTNTAANYNTNATVNYNTNSAVNYNTNTSSNVNVNAAPASNSNTNTPTNANSNTNSTVSPTAGWKTYSNTKYGYTVRYPSDWITVGGATADNAGFRPTTANEAIWSVTVYSNKSVEDVIAQWGEQFDDRKETRATVAIGSITATKATITTQLFLNWKAEVIVFERSGKVYEITNGAIIDTKYENFYSSFSF